MTPQITFFPTSDSGRRNRNKEEREKRWSEKFINRGGERGKGGGRILVTTETEKVQVETSTRDQA